MSAMPSRLIRKIGTTFWRDAVDKEMKKALVALEEWDGTVEEARGGKKLVG